MTGQHEVVALQRARRRGNSNATLRNGDVLTIPATSGLERLGASIALKV